MGWRKADINARKIGDYFTVDKLALGTATLLASNTSTVVAHGLGTTPTFLMATGQGTTAADRAVVISADATNVTLSHVDTDGATQSVSWIAGVLS
jgi:hypothetical protein